MKFEMTKRLTALETVLALALSLFGSKVSALINVSPYLIVFFFLAFFVALLIVKLSADSRKREPSATNTGENVPLSASISHVKDMVNSLSNPRTAFTLGITIGVLIPMCGLLAPGKFLSQTFYFEYIPFTFESSNGWIATIFLAAAILVGFSFKYESATLRSLAIGLGLGIAGVALSLSKEQRVDIFAILIPTPLCLWLFARLLRESTRIWRYVVVSLLVVNVIVIQATYRAPDSRPWVETTSGTTNLFSDGEHSIYYEKPFRQTPFLKVRQGFWYNDSLRILARFAVTQQYPDHFAVKISNNRVFPFILEFEAKGVLADEKK